MSLSAANYYTWGIISICESVLETIQYLVGVFDMIQVSDILIFYPLAVCDLTQHPASVSWVRAE